MNEAYDTEIAKFNDLMKKYGGVDSYTTDQAVDLIQQLNVLIRMHGLDPQTRAGFFEGICKVFNIELINMYLPQTISVSLTGRYSAR